MKTNRIESLDSLRGIAAMVVVIFHCLMSFTLFHDANYEYKFNNLLVELFTVSPLHTLWAGKEAVLLFFVLSGFVLMIPFTNNKKPKYSSYLLKRICRIYIPYIVVMFFSVVLAFFFWQHNNLEGMSPLYENRWDHEISLKSIVAYFTMLNYDTANVNGVVWTLFIEMKVSLYLPLFMMILAKFDWKKGLFITTVLNTILLFVARYGVLNVTFLPLRALFIFFNDTFYYNYFFILGVVLAKQRCAFLKYSAMKEYLKYLLLVLSLVLINSRWADYMTDYQKENIENIISALGFALLFFVVLISKNVDQFLKKKPLAYLGKISYSLYLIHIPVLMLTTVILSKIIPVWLTFCLVPIFCLPVAHLTYKWIEVPSMKLGKRLSKYDLKSILLNKSKLNKSIDKAQ